MNEIKHKLNPKRYNNFQMETLKDLYPFYSKEYPMKIHFSTFRYSFDFFSSGTCTYAMQLYILKCETIGFLFVNFSLGVFRKHICY